MATFYHSDLRVLRYLIEQGGRHPDGCEVTMSDISRATGIGRHTIAMRVKSLERYKFVKVTRGNVTLTYRVLATESEMDRMTAELEAVQSHVEPELKAEIFKRVDSYLNENSDMLAKEFGYGEYAFRGVMRHVRTLIDFTFAFRYVQLPSELRRDLTRHVWRFLGAQNAPMKQPDSAQLMRVIGAWQKRVLKGAREGAAGGDDDGEATEARNLAADDHTA